MIYETESFNQEFYTPKSNRKKFILFVGSALILFFFWSLLVPPSGTPSKSIIEIKKGVGVKQVSLLLYDAGVISSPSLFTTLITVLGDEKKIDLGVYKFDTGVSVLEARRRILEGFFGIDAKKVTIPEGFTNLQIAERLESSLWKFDKTEFLRLAEGSEGTLFPETYFFLPSDTEDIVFKKMRDVFETKTKDILSKSASKQEAIIMASILEKEVRDAEDMKIVSGILWKRIKIGMPLQVDATLAYERHKDSYTLTTADLRTDSTYNTYTRKGLPPTPISNPGLNAIVGAIEPQASPYLYFLTDKEGKAYYAKTYTEHLRNKAKYL